MASNGFGVVNASLQPPQSDGNQVDDYLASINQTLSPVIEPHLTATMSEIKQKIEALNQCAQEGRENCRPTTSAPDTTATTQTEVSRANRPDLSLVAAGAVAAALSQQG